MMTYGIRVVRTVFLMASAVVLLGCGLQQQTAHEKLGWKAGDFFKDEKVIALCKAIEANNLDEMKRLIKDGVDVNAQGLHNMTPLLWAFLENRPERFELLLKNGADPNVFLTGRPDKNSGFKAGDSVTHRSATSGFPDHFKLVMKYGGKPNLVNPVNDEDTVIAVITGFGRDKKERLKLLIEAKANLDHNSSKTGKTPLRAAVGWGGQFDLALMLLKAGADHKQYFDSGLSKFVHSVVSREKRNGKRWSPETRKEFQAVADWLEEHGEDLDKAREDTERWSSWCCTPKDIKRLREKEIAERKAREKAQLEKKKANEN